MWQQTQCFLLILSVIITGSLSVSWNVVVSPNVTVSRGEDAVLSCSFTHPGQQNYKGMINVKWLARESNAQPFFSCSVKNDSMEEPNHCSDSTLRFSLNGDPRRGELSLLIRKVQLNDNGTYFCRVELDGSWSPSSKKTQLYVTAKPQIQSLSVLEPPSGSDSASRRLQCEVEGHPLPKIVWLSASRRMIENQGQTSTSGPYRQISSVPYLEEEVLTCRAESELGEAERTYPTNNTLMITLIVCGLILLLLLLLSTGIIIYCRRKRARDDASHVYGNAEVVENHGRRGSDSAADTETQLVYSLVTISSTLPKPNSSTNSTQQHEVREVFYSNVNIQ